MSTKSTRTPKIAGTCSTDMPKSGGKYCVDFISLSNKMTKPHNLKCIISNAEIIKKCLFYVKPLLKIIDCSFAESSYYLQIIGT